MQNISFGAAILAGHIMWIRNVVFIAICLAGSIALGALLLTDLGARRESRLDRQETNRAVRQHKNLEPVVEEINAEFRRIWSDLELKPAPRAPDLAIARRLSLSLVGTVPSLEEIREFEEFPAEQRVDVWLNHLLQDRRSGDYLAERLARAYVGVENGPFIVFRRRRFVLWLSERLHNNARYDGLVRDLVTDTGLWTDSPAVNFMTVTMDENDKGKPDPIRLAARTTRAFLGMRIDCVQCHDDKLGNVELGSSDDPRYGEQKDFHQLAAFFSEAQSTGLGIQDRSKKPYKVMYLNDEEESEVDASVPFLDELKPSNGNRRQQLAGWLTHKENRQFARAAVNRFWAIMLGRPLVDPIDDIPLHGPFPKVLEILADDFIANNYNIHRLLRIIAATEVFQIDSRAEHDLTERHEEQWAVFPITRLRPEQVAGSIIQTSSLTTIDSDAHIITRLSRFGEENDFIKRYGDMGEEEFTPRSGTIAQRLLMLNGKLVAERISDNPLRSAAKISTLAPSDETAVEMMYLITLTRAPTVQEMNHFTDRLNGKNGGQRTQVIQDILVSICNSTEYCWNH